MCCSIVAEFCYVRFGQAEKAGTLVGGVSNPIYTLICHKLNKDVPVFYGK